MVQSITFGMISNFYVGKSYKKKCCPQMHKLVLLFFFFSCRPGLKAADDCVSDQESSDEDMDWSGNSSLFGNLSIPQLDGAADESSGK